MSEEKKRRNRRSTEELIAEQEQKLAAENKRHEETVATIKARIAKLKNPPKPKMTKAQKNKKIMENLMKKYDNNAEKLAEALGVNIEELMK